MLEIQSLYICLNFTIPIFMGIVHVLDMLLKIVFGVHTRGVVIKCTNSTSLYKFKHLDKVKI